MGYLRGGSGNWEMGSGVYGRHIIGIKKFLGLSPCGDDGEGMRGSGGLMGFGDGVIFYKY